MTRPVSNLRLFVAVYPPLDVARAMVDAVERLSIAGRMTPIEQVHMTVQFIGDTPAREMESVIESVARSAAGLERFVLTPRRLMSLPERGAARLIAAEMDAPAALLEMHRRLAHRLARNVRERAGDRFLAHMTLLRYKAGGARVDAALNAPGFEVREVSLMRSVLGPAGARHEVVREVLLG